MITFVLGFGVGLVVGRWWALAAALARYDAVWLRGGNVFVLRYALAASGGDEDLVRMLASDALVYAGYSAGPCVLAPSLRGLEAVDPPDRVTVAYGGEPIFAGLGILPGQVAPDALREPLGLADVEHSPGGILEEINPWH